MFVVNLPSVSLPSVKMAEQNRWSGIFSGKTIIVESPLGSVDLTINGIKKSYKVVPNVPTKIIYKGEPATSLKRMVGSNITRLDLTNFNTEKVTDLDILAYNAGLKYLLMGKVENCTTISNFLYGNWAKFIDVSKINTENLRSAGYAFMGNAITELDISTWNLGNLTSAVNMFGNCPNLEHLKFGYNLKEPISFGSSPLTHESALSVINGLAKTTAPLTVTFKETTYATLTEEEIAKATSKGWTIASK